jgi:LysM repeat protein
MFLIQALQNGATKESGLEFENPLELLRQNIVKMGGEVGKVVFDTVSALGHVMTDAWEHMINTVKEAFAPKVKSQTVTGPGLDDVPDFKEAKVRGYSPQFVKAPKPLTGHTVEKNENITQIAKKHGLTVYQLMLLNPEKFKAKGIHTMIHPGDQLVVDNPNINLGLLEMNASLGGFRDVLEKYGMEVTNEQAKKINWWELRQLMRNGAKYDAQIADFLLKNGVKSSAVEKRIQAFKRNDPKLYELIASKEGRQELDMKFLTAHGHENYKQMEIKPSEWAKLYYQYNVVHGLPVCNVWTGLDAAMHNIELPHGMVYDIQKYLRDEVEYNPNSEWGKIERGEDNGLDPGHKAAWQKAKAGYYTIALYAGWQPDPQVPWYKNVPMPNEHIARVDGTRAMRNKPFIYGYLHSRYAVESLPFSNTFGMTEYRLKNTNYYYYKKKANYDQGWWCK